MISKFFRWFSTSFLPAHSSDTTKITDLHKFLSMTQMRTVRRLLPTEEVYVYVLQYRQRRIRNTSFFYSFSIAPKSCMQMEELQFAEWGDWEDVPLIDEHTQKELRTFHTLSERKIVPEQINIDPSKLDNIQTRVRRIIGEQLGVEESEIKDGTHLIDDLRADSLDMVETVMALEDEFEVEIPDRDGEKFTTMDSIVQYLAKK